MPACAKAGRGRSAGACSEDISHFCTVIKPGEGRLYECLKAQRTNEQLGNNDGAQQTRASRKPLTLPACRSCA